MSLFCLFSMMVYSAEQGTADNAVAASSDGEYPLKVEIFAARAGNKLLRGGDQCGHRDGRDSPSAHHFIQGAQFDFGSSFRLLYRFDYDNCQNHIRRIRSPLVSDPD